MSATSTVSVNYAANSIEAGANEILLVATTDRMSNGPNILWPNSNGPGGKPDFESWVIDGFGWDPAAETSPVGTAENVAKKHGFTREQPDAMVTDEDGVLTEGSQAAIVQRSQLDPPQGRHPAGLIEQTPQRGNGEEPEVLR